MKSLLVSSFMFLNTTSSVIPLINQNTLEKQYSISWLNYNSTLEYENKYFNNLEAYSIRTINIGDFDISKYKTVSLLDPIKESYTKTSWGNNIYYGVVKEKINNLLIKDIFINKKIENQKDLENNDDWAFELLNINKTFWLTSIKTFHYIGFSYYFENGNNYIQVFLKHYVETFHSLVGGTMLTNLGRGLIFN